MPYKIKRCDCRDAKGKRGRYIVTKKGKNKQISCHKTKAKAKASIRAKHLNEGIQNRSEYVHEDIQNIAERVFLELLYENAKIKKSLNGSHPEEQYVEWHDFENEWFDKKGLTIWDEDRKTTKKYLEDIGLI